MMFHWKLAHALAAGAILASQTAAAQQSPEAAPPKSQKQILFDSYQAHYAAMIEGFNTATQYARNYGADRPTNACGFYQVALTDLSDAQDDLRSIISLLEEAHQEAAQYDASLDNNAAELVNWRNSFARNCPAR